MSWHYSQVLVAEYLLENSLDGAQSVPWNGNPTPQAYLCSDRMTAFSTRSLSGMTFAPLTADLGGELLTWFLGGLRAKTSALPGMAKGLKGSVPASGQKCGGSLARFCLDSFSWKTHQCLLFGGGARVIADLAALGYVGRWGVMGAGAAHSVCEGERMWIVAIEADSTMLEGVDVSKNFVPYQEKPRRRQYSRAIRQMLSQDDYSRIKRDAHAVAAQMDRLKAIGNGQVPAVAAMAFKILAGQDF